MLLEWGLIGLFVGCFLSATLIPFSSDVLFSAALIADYPAIAALIVATIGNFLGTITNYWIGRFIRAKRKSEPKALEKWKTFIKRFGIFAGIIAWVPFIGEPLVIVLGYLRVPFWKLSLVILLGVFSRYLVWFYLFG
jgi:membrane protein YqaA with SNARE-associated domain